MNFTVTTDKSTSNRQLWAHTGYLNSTTVTKMSNGYQISAKNVSGKLELHAYWDHSIFGNVSLSSKNRKSAIIKQEAKIVHRSQVLQMLLFYILPAIVIILIVGALVVFSEHSDLLDNMNILIENTFLRSARGLVATFSIEIHL